MTSEHIKLFKKVKNSNHHFIVKLKIWIIKTFIIHLWIELEIALFS